MRLLAFLSVALLLVGFASAKVRVDNVLITGNAHFHDTLWVDPYHSYYYEQVYQDSSFDCADEYGGTFHFIEGEHDEHEYIAPVMCPKRKYVGKEQTDEQRDYSIFSRPRMQVASKDIGIGGQMKVPTIMRQVSEKRRESSLPSFDTCMDTLSRTPSYSSLDEILTSNNIDYVCEDTFGKQYRAATLHEVLLYQTGQGGAGFYINTNAEADLFDTGYDEHDVHLYSTGYSENFWVRGPTGTDSWIPIKVQPATGGLQTHNSSTPLYAGVNVWEIRPAANRYHSGVHNVLCIDSKSELQFVYGFWEDEDVPEQQWNSSTPVPNPVLWTLREEKDARCVDSLGPDFRAATVTETLEQVQGVWNADNLQRQTYEFSACLQQYTEQSPSTMPMDQSGVWENMQWILFADTCMPSFPGHKWDEVLDCQTGNEKGSPRDCTAPGAMYSAEYNDPLDIFGDMVRDRTNADTVFTIACIRDRPAATFDDDRDFCPNIDP